MIQEELVDNPGNVLKLVYINSTIIQAQQVEEELNQGQQEPEVFQVYQDGGRVLWWKISHGGECKAENELRHSALSTLIKMCKYGGVTKQDSVFY